MPLITETYYLSLTQDNRGILRLRCSQDDTLRTVNLKLYNNGSIFTIPSGISAYVSGVKQNGAVFSKSCTISQDRKSVVLQLSSNITNVDGVIIAEIVLNDGNGDRLGSSNFIIQVEKNPTRVGVIQDTETPIEYVNDFITQIQALTARLNNLITPKGDPSLAEVVDARISSLDNNTYQNLKARIDADIATLNTRKANKSEVYTKAQVDTLLDNVEIDVDDELSDESENPVQNKVVAGAISKLQDDLTVKAVLFTEQDKTEEEKVIARNNIGAMANDADLLTDEIKSALINIFKHVAYTDGGDVYYKDLYELFYNGGDYKALYEMLDKYINDSEVDTGVALSKANFEYTVVIDATDTHIFTDMTNDIQRVLLSGIAPLPKETEGFYYVGPKIFVNNTGANSKTYFVNNSGMSNNFVTDNGKHSIYVIMKCDNIKATNMLWVDGIKIFENTNVIYDLHHGNTTVIGTQPGREYFWNGNVFRLSIYDYLLSDEEINALTNGITDKSQLLKIEKTYYSNERTPTDIQTNARTQDLTIIVKATHESPYNTDTFIQYNLLSCITSKNEQSAFMGIQLFVNTQNGSKTVAINCMGNFLQTQVENTNCSIFGILRFKTDSNGNNPNSYVYLDANGTKKEQSVASNNYYNHDKYLMIGDDTIGNNSDDRPTRRKWTGYVEVEVYNRALSDSEIQAIKEREG